MQISSIKNQNMEKPSRNPSNRTIVKILKKNFFLISLKKNLVPRMLSHRVNVRTSKFWRKSKETKRIFFRKFTKGILGFDLGQKKNSKISHACVPLKYSNAFECRLLHSVHLPTLGGFSRSRGRIQRKTWCMEP